MDKTKAKRISGGIIVSIIALIISLISLGYNIANRIMTQKREEERILSEKNMAVEYLREKYDMEAEAVDYSDRYGVSLVTMKFADREFSVLIDNFMETTDILDNYQYEEIENAFLDKIEEGLPGGEKFYCSIYGLAENSLIGYNTMFRKDEIFDGTNLDEVLKNHKGDITMLYADTEFNDCEIFDWLQEKRITARFISFDSQEKINWFAEYYDNINYIPYSKGIFAEFVPYISDIREIDDEKNTNTNYTIKKCDNFLYCCPENADANISEISQNEIIDRFNYYNEDKYVSNPLSKAYKADNSWKTVYVYYPLADIQQYNDSKVRMAWYVDGYQSNNRGIKNYTVFGDYAMFSLSFNNPEFMLVEAVDEDNTAA